MARIYISSTYNDLKDYREAVYRALRRMGHDVISMEDYTASDQRPLDKCLSDLTTCDLYLGIFAWRYGYIPPDQDKSITELEFRKAVECKKKCLIFLLDENASWNVPFMDQNLDNIRALREELKRDYLIDFFSTKDELVGDMSIAVSNALASKDGPKQSKPAGRDFRLEIMVQSPESGFRFNVLVQKQSSPDKLLLIFNLYKKIDGDFVQIVGIEFEAEKKEEKDAISNLAHHGVHVEQIRAFNNKVYPTVKEMSLHDEPIKASGQEIRKEISKAILLKV